MTLQESINTGIEMANNVDQGIKYALNSNTNTNAETDGGASKFTATLKTTWPIRYFFKKWACFKAWEPMRYETYQEIGMPRFAKYVNYLIKFFVAFITLLLLPIVPWIIIMKKSWSLFRRKVLFYIFGPIGKQFYRKVIFFLIFFGLALVLVFQDEDETGGLVTTHSM